MRCSKNWFLLLTKWALLGPYDQIIVPETFVNMPQMKGVFLFIPASDESIINIHKNRGEFCLSTSERFGQHYIGLRASAETPTNQKEWLLQSCVYQMDIQVSVVTADQVDLWENTCPGQPHREVLYVGSRISVRYQNWIHLMVIFTGPPLSGRFQGQMKGWGPLALVQGSPCKWMNLCPATASFSGCRWWDRTFMGGGYDG